MKKRYLWGAFVVVALASCSQDEVISIPQNEIKYSVVANKTSRADDVFCNNNKPETFYSSAYFNADANDLENTSGTYFVKDKLVVVETANEYVNETAQRYWPQSGSLDIYAYNGDNTSVKFEWPENPTTTPPTIDFEVAEEVEDQFDLLYAVKKGAKVAGGNIKLNFRHALSQIVFQAQNKNPNIYVKISGVEVHNVLNSGTFTFPPVDTDDNFEDHNQNGAGNTATEDIYNNFGDTQGDWDLGTSTDDYAVTLNSIAVPFNNKVNLTNNVIFESVDDVEDRLDEDLNEALAMLLMPQYTEALDPDKVDWKEGVTKIEGGAYFLVNCRIWNVAGEEYEEGDVLLYDNPILIPVNVEWKQGHKYVYTFIFDEQGNGGIDPDDGKPVLVPIEYTVTVDDFTNEAETEVDMKDDTVVDTTQKETTTGGN